MHTTLLQVITIERNELLALVACHKEKDIEREKDRERCTNTTNSVRAHTASQVDSALNNSNGHTLELFHTDEKGNKITSKNISMNNNTNKNMSTNKKKDSITRNDREKDKEIGKEEGREKGEKGMAGTLDREFLNNLFSTSDKSKHATYKSKYKQS